MKPKNHASLQRVHLISTSKKTLFSTDTQLKIAKVAKEQLEAKQERKNTTLDALVEDITSRTTLHLPAIALIAENQAQSNQNQVLTDTVGNAAIVGAGDLICTGLRYVTTIMMTNLFSQSVYGTYITVFTAATMVGTIAVLGVDKTILRFLSTYRAKKQYDLANGLIRFVLYMTLISGLSCGILFYLASTPLAQRIYHQDAYALPLKEVGLLVPLIVFQLVFASGLQALKAIKWKVYVDRLIQPGLTFVLTGALYLLGLRLEALIFATISGFMASAIMGYILLRRASKQYIQVTVPKFESKKWLLFALPLSFNSIIVNILGANDVLFLAAFANAAKVGLYATADRTSYVVLMPLFALSTVFSPLIAEYYANKKYEQLANLSKIITKWVFTLSLPVFLCLSVFHDAFLGIFSKGYTTAGMVLVIISFSNLVDAGVGSVVELLAMTGHTRIILINTFLTIIMNIALNLLLVPRFNIIGTAIATAVPIILLNIAGLIEVYCILKIFMFRWDMLKPVIAGGIASVVGLLLLRYIHIGYGYVAIFEILGLIVPFLFVYVWFLILLRFSEEDTVVLDAIRAKFSKKKFIK